MPQQESVIKRILQGARYLSVNVSGSAAKEYQTRTLKKLLTKASETEFGKEFDFTSILESPNVYAAFKQSVPMLDYSTIMPWWERSRQGVDNVTWPGKMDHFALSSGTSEGTSKYIPVSDDMVRFIRRAGVRQVIAIARTDVPKDHLTKHWLMIGGSTSLNYNGIYYSGDLSGITTAKIPPLFQRVSKPEPDIMSSTDWQEKIERITREAKNWDVGMVAGVPAWILLLFRNILDVYNLKNIHEIWPNLEVYIHGGVSIKPYEKSLNMLVGRPIKFFETYLASEGFIGFQTREEANGGIRMLLRNGIFFEFVPFNESNFDSEGTMLENAEALPIWETKEGVDYALLMTTCSGAWRYSIGDTVRFINHKKKEIIITGRTKHFISLVGEHLSIDNMTCALEMTANEMGQVFNEFTLAGIRYRDSLGHRWYIACDDSTISQAEVQRVLDKNLCSVNDDYSVERNHALSTVQVELIPTSFFLEWMRQNGKEGSQHKFPRVMKGEIFSNWQNFLEAKGVSVSEPAI